MEKKQQQPTDPHSVTDEQDAAIRSSALSDEALDAVTGGVLRKIKTNDEEAARRIPAGSSLEK